MAEVPCGREAVAREESKMIPRFQIRATGRMLGRLTR